MRESKIAALFGPNTFVFGDYYGQMALGALMRAKEKHHASFDLIVSPTPERIMQDMMSCCELHRYGVILAIGNAMQEPTARCAKEFPEQRFALIDGSVEALPNVISYSSDPLDISFLCGQVSAKMSKPPFVGCVLWADNWVANQWIVGFIHGAKEMESTAKVYFSYAKDSDEAYEKARLQFENGVEIIMCHAGSSDLGAIRAAGDLDKHVLGFLNEREVDPDHVLFDVVRSMDPAILDAIRQTLSKKFVGGRLVKLGLRAGSFGFDLANAHKEIGNKERKMISNMINEMKARKFDSKLKGMDERGSPIEIGGIRV